MTALELLSSVRGLENRTQSYNNNNLARDWLLQRHGVAYPQPPPLADVLTEFLVSCITLAQTNFIKPT